MHMQSTSFRRSFLGALTVAALVVTVLSWPSAAAARQGPLPGVVALQAQPAPAADGFEPVGQLPVQEQLPAAPMVMSAYAIVWVLTMAFVVSVWRRLDRVERELRDVEQRVAQAARRS